MTLQVMYPIIIPTSNEPLSPEATRGMIGTFIVLLILFILINAIVYLHWCFQKTEYKKSLLRILIDPDDANMGLFIFNATMLFLYGIILLFWLGDKAANYFL